jgi:hypothetical protein
MSIHLLLRWSFVRVSLPRLLRTCHLCSCLLGQHSRKFIGPGQLQNSGLSNGEFAQKRGDWHTSQFENSTPCRYSVRHPWTVRAPEAVSHDTGKGREARASWRKVPHRVAAVDHLRARRRQRQRARLRVSWDRLARPLFGHSGCGDCKWTLF